MTSKMTLPLTARLLISSRLRLVALLWASFFSIQSLQAHPGPHAPEESGAVGELASHLLSSPYHLAPLLLLGVGAVIFALRRRPQA